MWCNYYNEVDEGLYMIFNDVILTKWRISEILYIEETNIMVVKNDC
jgi:hypothetical protein